MLIEYSAFIYLSIMAIPKVIYQTFKTKQIPLLTKFYIWRFMRKNKDFHYEFYDDERIHQFMKESFEPRVYNAYSRLQIGAAKADFFRYAILYKKGGVYLDLDSDVRVKIDKYLKDSDEGIISHEGFHREFYVQWVLIFNKNHPFLKRTIDYMVENIEQNKYPHDVHAMTGPIVYSNAINDEIKENPNVKYRLLPDDYDNMFKFKYMLGKILIYGDRAKHWKNLQKTITVVKD